jgi:uncharacterized membrane protein
VTRYERRWAAGIPLAVYKSIVIITALTERSMAIRLQELHPALVHLPIALLPVAIGTDLAGRVTGDDGLREAGRHAMLLTAASAAESALTGLIAQEEVNVEGESMDTLITHRNINLAVTVLAGAMAVWRSKRDRPSTGYLGLGLAGIAAVAYTAYLGGKLVYQYGVGVEPAHGQYRTRPPELTAGQAAAFSKDAARDLAHGAAHLAQEVAKGKLAPSLGVGPRAVPKPAERGMTTGA